VVEIVKEIPWEFIGPFGALAVIMFICSCVFVVKMTKKKNGRCCDDANVRDAMTNNTIMKETVVDMKSFMQDSRSAHQDQTAVLKLLLDQTSLSNTHLASIAKNGRK